MLPMPAARRRGDRPPVLASTRVAAVLLLGAAAGCGLGSQPIPAVSSLMPAVAYNNAALPLAIVGTGFRPTYQVDARTGAASIDPGRFRVTLTASGVTGGAVVTLQDVLWQSEELLAAQLPAGTLPGPYDVTVTDPRGRVSVALSRGFQSLGADMTPPLVRIVSPPTGAIFAVGASVPIVATADDGAGTVTALTAVMSSGSGAQQPHDCPVTGEATASCAFTLSAPGAASTTDKLTIHVTATDDAGQVGEARAQFDLVRAPAFNSLSPTSGSTLGRTQVRIEGAGLMQPGVEVRFDGMPAEVQSQSANALEVLTPIHLLAGTVPVTVTIAGVTVGKDAGFTYVAPPLVRTIIPTSGPAAGGFPITVIGDNFVAQTTQIYFGTAPLRCVKYGNGNRIDGIAPPGVGTQAVIADDSVSGSIPNGTVPFRYVQDGGTDPYDASAGADPDGGAADAGCPGGP